MENIFETLAAAINPEIATMQSELIQIESRIKTLEAADNNSYTAQVAKSFHLGMVGGSGRNTYRLNKRRESELSRTMDRAKILVELYGKRDDLKTKIEYIQSGKRDAAKAKEQSRDELRAEYWRGLKAGDELNIGNSNGNPVILKKSQKSVLTTTGTKWTAAEIIGKKAASLL